MTSHSIMMTSMMLVIFVLLLSPLAPNVKSCTTKTIYLKVKNAIKSAFLISLLPLMIFLDEGLQMTVATITLCKIGFLDIKINFLFDAYTLMFIPVSLYVSWSIMEYSSWYMSSDPQKTRFYKYLLMFLVTMLILVSANNLFQLFIGWEGVGIMSFLLIGWWFSRSDANTAALQAVIYNRVGDIGLVITIAWTAAYMFSWDFQEIFANTAKLNLSLPMLGLILAAMGKSAQFGLHPWLPAAMEGPTPVSALLHSSTMVVAGIFLLIRLSPVMENNSGAQKICLCLGATTSFYAALCALTQNDIKKIVAFSTSSQLGLMMVAIGLNQPQLAFIHVCTHAFFKAMLFLCAGSIIHNLNDEQDIRKMGGMHHLSPIVSSSLIVGTMALMGAPFLSGFYSKDAIIEALTTSNVNAWALTMTLIATCFTAIYSIRLLILVCLGYPRFNSMSPINENIPEAINPIKRLAWGSIISGLLITFNILPLKTPVMTMPLHLKMAALAVTIIGLVLGAQLAMITAKQIKPVPTLPPQRFTTLLAFFPIIFHRLIPNMALKLGQKIANQTIDQTWMEKAGPKAMPKLNLPLVKMMSDAQQGKIKIHLMMFITTMVLMLIITYSIAR